MEIITEEDMTKLLIIEEKRTKYYLGKWVYKIIWEIGPKSITLYHHLRRCIGDRGYLQRKYRSFILYTNDLVLFEKYLDDVKWKKYGKFTVTKALLYFSNCKKYIIMKKEPKFRYRLTIQAGKQKDQRKLANYFRDNKDRVKLLFNAKFLVGVLPKHKEFSWGMNLLIYTKGKINYLHNSAKLSIDTNDEADVTMLTLKGFKVDMQHIISEKEAEEIRAKKCDNSSKD